MTRFSKEAVMRHLEKRAKILKERHHFDLDDGTSQLVGRTQAEVLAYGEMKACLQLVNDIAGGYIKG